MRKKGKSKNPDDIELAELQELEESYKCEKQTCQTFEEFIKCTKDKEKITLETKTGPELCAIIKELRDAIINPNKKKILISPNNLPEAVTKLIVLMKLLPGDSDKKAIIMLQLHDWVDVDSSLNNLVNLTINQFPFPRIATIIEFTGNLDVLTARFLLSSTLKKLYTVCIKDIKETRMSYRQILCTEKFFH